MGPTKLSRISEIIFRLGRAGGFKNFRNTSQIITHFDQQNALINTLRTGDADLRFYVTTVQDG